jgi:hypothetical protein
MADYCAASAGFRVDETAKTVQLIHNQGGEWKTCGETWSYPISPMEFLEMLNPVGNQTAWALAWLLLTRENEKLAAKLFDILTAERARVPSP